MRRRIHGPPTASPASGTSASHAASAGADRSPAASRSVARAMNLARRTGNIALEHALVRSAGSPLNGAAAARQGRALGRPVDGVRVADDAAAHAAARSLNATAFTVGGTIHLGRDAPPPGTAAGQRLLAHELAHVLQQADARGAPSETVSAPHDPHERAATSAALTTGHADGDGALATVAGATPTVQREPAGPTTTTTAPAQPAVGPTAKAAPATLSRAELTGVLEGYFQRLLAQQGGRSVRITDDVKFALRRVFAGDPMGEMPLLGYLGGTTFPSTPAALAAEVAKRMPDPVPSARVAHLAAGPAAPEGKGKLGRVADLVASTAPNISSEQQRSQWAFDQASKDLRRGENAVGPFGVDLQRAAAIGAGLPKALAGPGPGGPTARSYPAVDAAVDSMAPGALTPAEVAGSPAVDEYADAQVLARALARDLDVAQQARRATIALRLGANYLKAKDRDAIIAAVERIVALVREALPHHASAVDAVDLYFGELRVRRITAAVKAP